jgi:O-6-methylguanine DNA methyltransferase
MKPSSPNGSVGDPAALIWNFLGKMNRSSVERGEPMPIPKTVLEKMKVYTPFSQAVWRACADIPAGETRTYGWIAKRIGRPAAARAVGRALGANPFAPVIPCHRVVGSTVA